MPDDWFTASWSSNEVRIVGEVLVPPMHFVEVKGAHTWRLPSCPLCPASNDAKHRQAPRLRRDRTRQVRAHKAQAGKRSERDVFAFWSRYEFEDEE